MEERYSYALTGAILGNALGTTLHGMSAAHIASVFGRIDSFTDPEPALKHKMDQWKKPALYGSTAQLMLLMALASAGRRNSDSLFPDYVRRGADAGDTDHGIFRNPSPSERGLLLRLKGGDGGPRPAAGPIPDASVAAVLVPLAFTKNTDISRLVRETILCAKLFTEDAASIAGALVFLNLLLNIARVRPEPSSDLIGSARNSIGALADHIAANPRELFSCGVNPDTILGEVKEHLSILGDLVSCTSAKEAEPKIVARANRLANGHITRATVNLPAAIIPYIISIVAFSSARPETILFEAASEGGAAAILCSLAGSLAGAFYGEAAIPDRLSADLINKTRIREMVAAIAGDRVSDRAVGEFIESEQALTRKAQDEYNARMRHVKPKEKKQKPRGDRERELSRHVIESWTKADKAKWKKQKKRYEEDGD